MKTEDYLNRENDNLDNYLMDMDMSGGLYEEYQKVAKRVVKKAKKSKKPKKAKK